MFVWLSGSGVLYDGTALAAMHKIVVVTINYRLAPFGELSADSTSNEMSFCGNDSVPGTGFIHDDKGGKEVPATGHLGHLDQRTALQWVQKYVKYFGGDPNQVTLAGQSAGKSP